MMVLVNTAFDPSKNIPSPFAVLSALLLAIVLLITDTLSSIIYNPPPLSASLFVIIFPIRSISVLPSI